MKKYILTSVILLLVAHLTTAQISLPEGEHLIFEHDGQDRTYLFYSASAAPDKLIIALHHFAENGRTMAIQTGLNAIADANNYAVVYPDALGYYWDDGRIAANVPPDDGTIADSDFILALRNNLSEQFNLNKEDIFLIGHENGGGLAYQLACDAPEQFEKIVVVGALLWEYHRDNCNDVSGQSNLLILYGERDPLYLHTGNELEYLRTGATVNILNRNDTLAHWIDVYDCDESEMQAYNRASVFVYESCGDGSFTFINIAQANGAWVRSGYAINAIGIDYTDIIAAYLIDADTWYETGDVTEPPLPRDYTLYVPYSYDATTDTPLVMHLHGRTATGNSQAHTSDFNRLAEAEGIIAIYPDGINNEWNYGKDLPILFSTAEHDDEQFFRDIITDLQQDLAIDASRIYVTGLSNGGFMTQRLACNMQDTFAAFASVAATAPAGLRLFCSQDGVRPVPILYIHGTADQLVAWDGYQQQLSDGRTVWIYEPMQQTFAFWAEHNGCDLDLNGEELEATRPTETTTVIMRITGCPDGAAVELYAVNNGGHVWHGVREYDVDYLGYESFDFNSSEVIWDFFKQFSLTND